MLNRSYKNLMPVLLFGLVLAGQPVQAQPCDLAEDVWFIGWGGHSIRFGESVSLSGDTAIVGAPLFFPGEAFIFQRVLGGPDNGPFPEGCDAFDFDGDLDIDLVDFASFQVQFGSP